MTAKPDVSERKARVRRVYLCLRCRLLKKHGLSAADEMRGVRHLFRCLAGVFTLRERHLLPRFNVKAGETCPSFRPSGARRQKYSNIEALLPPDLVEKVRAYITGPRIIYIPAANRRNAPQREGAKDVKA